MRGEYKGKWYARVFESTRFVGTKTLDVVEFNTKEEMESFILDYNTCLLEHEGITPETYKMAEWASIYDIR